jgi:hypothetical protein
MVLNIYLKITEVCNFETWAFLVGSRCFDSPKSRTNSKSCLIKIREMAQLLILPIH